MAWLAGLLEGEGCFTRRANGYARVSVDMTDRDVIERVGEMLGRAVQVKRIPSFPAHYKERYRVDIGGSHAVALMSLIRPWMGARRRAKIDEELEACD